MLDDNVVHTPAGFFTRRATLSVPVARKNMGPWPIVIVTTPPCCDSFRYQAVVTVHSAYNSLGPAGGESEGGQVK